MFGLSGQRIDQMTRVADVLGRDIDYDSVHETLQRSARRQPRTSRAPSWRGSSDEDEHLPPEEHVKKTLQKIRLRYLAHKDVARFSRTASFSIYDGGYEQVVSRIMYNVHALEKGLARGRDARLGFGRKALSDLNDALVVYSMKGFDRAAYAYAQGVSVIRRYQELHEKQQFDVGFLSEIIDPEFLKSEADVGVAGDQDHPAGRQGTQSREELYEIAQGRSSSREFTGRPIDTDKVMNALRNAEKTPSVCNRQGWRVYWVENKDLAAKVLKHQRGFGSPRCRRCCSDHRV